jgi:hypothetical protein
MYSNILTRIWSLGRISCPTVMSRLNSELEETAVRTFDAFPLDGSMSRSRSSTGGDAVSVAGMGKLTQWTGRDNIEKHGISITVQAVLSIYQARKRKREAPEQQDEELMT